MWLMQRVSASRLMSEKLKIELYPPFFLMRVKVLEISRKWRTVRMRLPLNTVSRNPGGVMFGGFQAALADPVAALACSRVFPGYSCWTRAMSIDFKVPWRVTPLPRVIVLFLTAQEMVVLSSRPLPDNDTP